MLKYLTVVTFNIRHGKGIDGKLSLSGAARTLQKINPHIVGLQEVDNFIPRSFFQKQARKLARYLGARYAFAPNLKWARCMGYGNAAISKFPILKTYNTLLPGDLEQRGLQYCLLSLPGTRPVHFFNTHLGLSTKDRTVQINAIIEKLPERHKPVILTGDFNTSLNSPELQPLLKRLRHTGAGKKLLTYPAPEPQYSIDHIFVSHHWQVKDIKVVKSRASDHLPLVCTLELISK